MKHVKPRALKLLYENALKEAEFFHFKLVNDLVQFKLQVDIIVANHLSDDIDDLAKKITAVINLGEIRKSCCR